MKPNQHINIPKPCHEQWQQMTTVSDGRYCGHCCKTVVDFTGMSNDEVIAYVAGNQNTCGRFEAVQLKKLNNNLDKSRFLWRSLIAAASLISMATFTMANARSSMSPGIQTDTTLNKRNAKGSVQTSLKKQISHLPGITKSGKRIISGTSLNRDTLVLRRITFTSPAVSHPQLHDTSVSEPLANVTYVLGCITAGVTIKEKEVDRELLYELGIR